MWRGKSYSKLTVRCGKIYFCHNKIFERNTVTHCFCRRQIYIKEVLGEVSYKTITKKFHSTTGENFWETELMQLFSFCDESNAIPSAQLLESLAEINTITTLPAALNRAVDTTNLMENRGKMLRLCADLKSYLTHMATPLAPLSTQLITAYNAWQKRPINQMIMQQWFDNLNQTKNTHTLYHNTFINELNSAVVAKPYFENSSSSLINSLNKLVYDPNTKRVLKGIEFENLKALKIDYESHQSLFLLHLNAAKAAVMGYCEHREQLAKFIMTS